MNRCQQPRHIGDRAVVPKHDIVAGACGYPITSGAAHEHALAGAYRNRVVAAVGGVRRLGEAQGAGCVDEVAIVADDHAGTSPHADTVSANPANHDLIASAQRDRIVAAQSRRIRCDARQHAPGPGHRAIVTQHDIVARARRHDVST